MDQEMIKNEIAHILVSMGFAFETIEAHQGSASRFSVHMTEDARMLIGERGNNLAALEYLVKRIVRRQSGQEVKFTLDVNDYRMKRLECLKQDVKNASRQVRVYNREMPLRPMSAFERRIVHLLLAEYPDITTESVGQGDERRVVIKPYP